MNPILRTRLLTVAGAAAIFLFGGITGSLATLAVAKKKIAERARATPAEMAARWMEKMDQQLVLTPEQESAFRPVIEESLRDLQSLRRRSFLATRQILEGTESRLLPLLDPDQQQKYEKFRNERREKIRALLGAKDPDPEP
ncbi:MAG: hypothetical protein SFU85_10305 [Candidatus Methylacidiphilales bacterium]|nr:hypothetical protein [Candidatus Methylacidiphilales bacterium]